MKKLISGALVCLMVLFIYTNNYLYNSVGAAQDDEKLLTIFHTNDMHGNVGGTLKKDKLVNIGLDYVKNMKDSTPNSLLLDAGDAIQGNSLANYSNGSAIIDLMNATGYNASTLGNHCFDFGKKAFEDNAIKANFPFLCANLKYIKNDKIDEDDPLDYEDSGDIFLTRLYKESQKSNFNGSNMVIEKEINGKKYKIGIFGLTTDDTTEKMNPKYVNDLEISPSVDIAIEQSKYLRDVEKVDLIIALTHVGMNKNGSNQSYKIAQAAIQANAPIDIILDGHSHTAANMCVDSNGIKLSQYDKAAVNEQTLDMGTGTVVQQTFKELSYAGQLKVDFDNKKISYKLLSPSEIQSKYKPDESISKLWKDIYDGQSSIRDEQVAIADKSLYSYAYNGIDNEKVGERIVRFSECALGNLVTDSFRWKTKNDISAEYKNFPVIGAQNGAAIRSRMEPGPITRGQLDQVSIYGGSLSGRKISPQILYSVLENSVSKIPANPSKVDTGISVDDGRFLQISGIRFEYDPTKPEGERVKGAYLLNDNGEYSKTALDKNDTESNIIIVFNDFEATGQDGYTMLPDLEEVFSGSSCQDTVVEYVKSIKNSKTGVFKVPVNEGRISLVDNGGFTGVFNSTITIVENNSGSAVKNSKVNISVDGADAKEFTTDENGKITIQNLSMSGHDIGVNFNNMCTNGYVDGRTGSTNVILHGQDEGALYDMKNVTLTLFESSKAVNNSSKISDQISWQSGLLIIAVAFILKAAAIGIAFGIINHRNKSK